MIASLAPIFPACGQVPERGMFWSPELDQPIQQLEEILGQTDQQQSASYTIANLSILYDAKLLFLFQKYIHRLPASKRQDAIRNQQQWLAGRESLMVKAAKEYEGGSLVPYVAGETKIKATKARINELQLKLEKGLPAA
jgi:uncharacterized protein YecT (DUF1311 family)